MVEEERKWKKQIPLQVIPQKAKMDQQYHKSLMIMRLFKKEFSIGTTCEMELSLFLFKIELFRQ
jgi:hypothetical protein